MVLDAAKQPGRSSGVLCPVITCWDLIMKAVQGH